MTTWKTAWNSCECIKIKKLATNLNILVNLTIEHKVNRSSSSGWQVTCLPSLRSTLRSIFVCNSWTWRNFCLWDWNLIKTCKGLYISSGCWCQDQWTVKRIITEDVQNFAEPQFVLLCQGLRLYDRNTWEPGSVSHRFPRVLLVCLQRCWNEADLVCWWELFLCFAWVHFSSTVKFVSPSKKFPTQTSCSPAEQPSSQTLKW